ncbi:Aspartate racemase [Linum grandiflorum]
MTMLSAQFSSVLIHTAASSGQISSSRGSSMSSRRNHKLHLPMSHRPGNTVGIITGVSVFSTLTFLEKLIWWSLQESQDCPPFILSNDPTLTAASLMLCKTRLNLDQIIDNLHGKRLFLEQSGVGCLVMPCHVSHQWYSEIYRGSVLPFFHLGDCVVSELKGANLKPMVCGNSVRIGVLATNPILEAGFYQEKLQSQGFEVVVPDKGTVDHILNPGIEALGKGDMEGAQVLVRIAIQVLLVRGVNVVILASHEIQGLLPDQDPLLQKCIDPMDALAKSVVRWAKIERENRTL